MKLTEYEHDALLQTVLAFKALLKVIRPLYAPTNTVAWRTLDSLDLQVDDVVVLLTRSHPPRAIKGDD